jgi:predicted RNase H-like nuclease
MKFIGLDLAWSPRNPTGGAVIEGDERGGRFIDAALLSDDASLIAYVEQHAGDGPAIVAVDAPLWVPNETGRRLGEAELGAVFAKYQAGAHPANRQRLAFEGVVRGEALVAALETRGFVHAPMIEAGKAVRQVIEVFPHPAMIALFGLQRTLKYKAKPNRSRDAIMAAWQQYRGHLRDLARADPPLHNHEALLEADLSNLRGKRLKDYEDCIDALMCAYIALYGFRWGAARCRVFGTMEAGYIFTPVPPKMI